MRRTLILILAAAFGSSAAAEPLHSHARVHHPSRLDPSSDDLHQLRAAIRSDPEFAGLVEGLVQLSEGRFDEAESTLRPLAAERPAARLLLGLVLYRAGQLTEAREALAAGGARERPPWALLLARVERHLDRPEASLATLDGALAVAPNDSGLLIERALALVDLGLYHSATRAIDAALLAAPNAAVWTAQLLALLDAAPAPRAAERLLRVRLLRNPESPRNQLDLARRLLSAGAAGEAARVLEVGNLDRDAAEAWRAAGDLRSAERRHRWVREGRIRQRLALRFEAERWDEAALWASQLKDPSRDERAAWAYALLRTGRIDEAREVARELGPSTLLSAIERCSAAPERCQ